jgi:hypothetical protein
MFLNMKPQVPYRAGEFVAECSKRIMLIVFTQNRGTRENISLLDFSKNIFRYFSSIILIVLSGNYYLHLFF